VAFPIKHTHDLSEQGFTTIDDIFSDIEIKSILGCIEQVDTSGPRFRKSGDLFAIRQFLKEVPEVIPYLFNEKLDTLIRELFGNDFFVIKSIYFDKPGQSNWFVSYHQDLTISVDKRIALEGFRSWTVKENQYAVQPPPDILESIFTVRIHLDDTDESNGALRVIPASHRKGIVRFENMDRISGEEVTCNVRRGGVMVMRPLLLHASSRTTNSRQRRVIHIEFSNRSLPETLQWAEQQV
jgi:ectoine hydroxylase-related dioxygenase (phytanoyl-CoA dioxygenase family)